VRIATYNVNGINGRLTNLLDWLQEVRPDIACLQELRAPDEKFPAAAIRAAGYGAAWQGEKGWNGVAILARDGEPTVTRGGLPGDPDDRHSRYIEAAVNGVIVGCLYLPNGNPAPGPKFDYKLRWFERLSEHASDHAPAWIEIADAKAIVPRRGRRFREDHKLTDGFDFERFVTAQEPVFDAVLSEARAGPRRSHWMWFVLN
jgi:hypothetical protein